MPNESHADKTQQSIEQSEIEGLKLRVELLTEEIKNLRQELAALQEELVPDLGPDVLPVPSPEEP